MNYSSLFVASYFESISRKGNGTHESKPNNGRSDFHTIHFPVLKYCMLCISAELCIIYDLIRVQKRIDPITNMGDLVCPNYNKVLLMHKQF